MREVRHAEDDESRLAYVLLEAKHEVGMLAPAAAARDAGRTADFHARAFAAGRGESSVAGGAFGGAGAGPLPADAGRHKRGRDDDVYASGSDKLADAAHSGSGRLSTSFGAFGSSGTFPKSTGVGENA